MDPFLLTKDYIMNIINRLSNQELVDFLELNKEDKLSYIETSDKQPQWSHKQILFKVKLDSRINNIIKGPGIYVD